MAWSQPHPERLIAAIIPHLAQALLKIELLMTHRIVVGCATEEIAQPGIEVGRLKAMRVGVSLSPARGICH
jgi:hypothetical protein